MHTYKNVCCWLRMFERLGVLLGTESAECHWNKNKCGFAMATDECQSREGGRRIKAPCSSQQREKNERTWLNHHRCCWSPQPQLFSSSISVCCDMLRSEISSDVCRFMQECSLCLSAQTETQWYLENTAMHTEQLKANASPPWALLCI